MKSDIVLAGVGGQGILTIAAIIGQAAVSQGIQVKQSEVHGMAQRGGSVVAHLRLSSAPVKSDLIELGTAHVVLGMEPMEALRQLPYLSAKGVLLANTTPIRNIGDYPELELILGELRKFPRTAVMDADEMAKTAGSPRAANMVLLGAISNFLELPAGLLTDAIRKMFARKGEEIVQANLKAFDAGRTLTANL
ncbi:MAG: indolepyruvate oxidoreductase subunit beta [Lentisphaeria bacterium]|nr:indolepyruvate oxidoreductase subunit beta [Lentisphaeria bacterium]